MGTNQWGQPVGEPVATAAALAPDGRPLLGDDIALVPLEPAHATALLDWGRRPELWTYLGWEPPDTLGEAEAQCAPRDGWVDYAVVPRETIDGAMAGGAGAGKAVTIGADAPCDPAAVLGRASLLRCDLAARSVEVGGILYSPRLQRTRAATEVQYVLARHAFEDLGMRRYEWKCDALNAPSRRAAERLGFRFEGIFRQAMVVKGRNRDTAWYSMLDGEWPAARAALEAWLAPGNRGADGVQRESLSAVRARLGETR